MTLEDAIVRYKAIEEDKKAPFLTSLSYELDENLPADLRIGRLIGCNELQHHLSSQARHHINQDTERYPDEVFIRILAEKASRYQLTGHFAGALTRCLGAAA